ncbi:MAG: hypothetical protein KF905_12725 [Flavobacteriales bacterium]|nr:hypothetical protein [Flavobacteriales bacterium]
MRRINWSWLRTKGPRLAERLIPLVALMLLGLLYYLGIYSERTGFVEQVLDPNLKRVTNPVLNAFRGKPPAVPLLDIRLEDDALDSLWSMRDRALEAGWVEAQMAHPVPVKLHSGKAYKVATLALREGHADRLSDDRWPFHLRLAPGDTLLGMESFDLQAVRNAAPLYAWLFQQAVGEEGAPAFPVALSDLKLNGRDLGLYALEGRVDSTLLKHWGHGIGPVMRFDDGLRNQAELAMSARRYPSDPPPQSEWLSAPILASRMNTVLSNPVHAARFRSAMAALESFRSGTVPASEVFDAKGFARLLALSDLLGAADAMNWWNLRFLADSVSGKLLPLPQRGHSGEPIRNLQALRSGRSMRQGPPSSDFVDRILYDPIIYQHYVAYLDTFSRPGWLEGLLERNAEVLASLEKILSAELPGSKFEVDIAEHCRTLIQQNLSPRDLVLAYPNSTGDRVSVANVHALPVEVVALITERDTVAFTRPVLLWPRERDRPITYTTMPTPASGRSGRPSAVLVRLVGLENTRSVSIRAITILRAQ